MSLGTAVTVDGTLEDVLAATKAALQTQGFGVLAEMDVAATIAEKIGVEREPLVILGACNPTLANRALDAEPSIALLLPCNVVVRGRDGSITVEAIEPDMLVTTTGNEALASIADEAGERLRAAIEAIPGARATTG